MRLQNFFVWLLFTGVACSSAAQQPTNLTVNQFEKDLDQKNIQLLDVRTPGEYQSGYLKNAVLADWMNPQDFNKKISTLNKAIPVYTYCLVGGRSGEAAKLLTTKGFKVYNLEGGIAAWKKAGKPVVDPVGSKE